MVLNRYQWAAIAAALFLPAVAMAATRKQKKSKSLNNPVNATGNKNLRAFLFMIQYAEGTLGKNAYRTMYGGTLFSDYSRHPNQAIKKWGITSTGAGAYGFLYRVWVELASALNLPNFSPASQDAAAIELIRRKRALSDVEHGYITQAIYKCRKIWASFPGAGYGQSEKPLQKLLQFYTSAGGELKQ